MKLNLLLMLSVLLAQTGWTAEPAKDLSRQIAEVMFQAAGNHPGYRPVHAKGIVCKGTFAPSLDGQTVSRAAHFQGAQILPVSGAQHLDASAAKAKAPNFLFEELPTRLAEGPAKFRLVLQLASPGDRTDDSTVVWPDDRKIVELGTITLITVDPDSATTEKALAFDPTRLTDGIEFVGRSIASVAVTGLRPFGRASAHAITFPQSVGK